MTWRAERKEKPRRQRKAPGGGEASRGPSVPRCLGGRVGGNASSHYKAKGRRRATVCAPFPLPKCPHTPGRRRSADAPPPGAPAAGGELVVLGYPRQELPIKQPDRATIPILAREFGSDQWRAERKKSPDARPGLRRPVGEASNEGIHMDRLSLSPHGCAINAVRGKQSMTEFAREAIAREIQRRLTEAENKGRSSSWLSANSLDQVHQSCSRHLHEILRGPPIAFRVRTYPFCLVQQPERKSFCVLIKQLVSPQRTAFR